METMDTTQIYPSELTTEELRILEALKNRPIVYDEDCPETTPERAIRFRRVNPGGNGHKSRL